MAETRDIDGARSESGSFAPANANRTLMISSHEAQDFDIRLPADFGRSPDGADGLSVEPQAPSDRRANCEATPVDYAPVAQATAFVLAARSWLARSTILVRQPVRANMAAANASSCGLAGVVSRIFACAS